MLLLAGLWSYLPLFKKKGWGIESWVQYTARVTRGLENGRFGTVTLFISFVLFFSSQGVRAA